MPKLLKAAYLRLCKECGEAGQIFCADGTASQVFGTRQKASAELARLKEEGRIGSEEADFLRDEIAKLTIPGSSRMIDATFDSYAFSGLTTLCSEAPKQAPFPETGEESRHYTIH